MLNDESGKGHELQIETLKESRSEPMTEAHRCISDEIPKTELPSAEPSRVFSQRG
jgi:hypothetical protein